MAVSKESLLENPIKSKNGPGRNNNNIATSMPEAGKGMATARIRTIDDNASPHGHQPSPTLSLLNPTHLIQKRHNDVLQASIELNARTNSGRPVLLPAMEQVKGTNMRINHADGTVVIYSSNGNGRDHRHAPPGNGNEGNSDAAFYFTEIPFAAVHGMQTRGRRRKSDQFVASCTSDFDYLDNCRMDHRVSTSNDDPNENDGYYGNLSPVGSRVGDLENDGGSTITRCLMVATIANSISQFLVGYNMTVLNTPEKYVFPGHATLAWSLAVSALAIGAPFGAVVGGYLADAWGRRYTLMANAFGFLLGGWLQTVAPTLPVLVIARFVLGLMSGIATVLVPIYLGELAPPSLRGTLGTINQFAFVVGILASDVLSIRFATAESWRLLLAVTCVLAAVQLLLMPWVVESPRFLLRANPHDLRARAILQTLRGVMTYNEIEAEVETYLQADAAELATMASPGGDTSSTFKNESPNTVNGNETSKNTYGSIFWEIMASDYLRFFFLCSLLLNVAEELCGVNAVFYYSTSVFEEIIDKPLLGTLSIGAVNVVFTYVALLLMDRCERKSLVLWSIGGMFISCTTLILYQTGIWKDTTGIIPVLSVNTYVAFYAIGIGPIPPLWVTEMVPPRYVSLTMSICSEVNWLINFAVGLAFPLMREQLEEWAFAPFAVVLLVSFLFVLSALPQKKRPSSNQRRHHHHNDDPNNRQGGLMKSNCTMLQSDELGSNEWHQQSSSVWV